MIATTTAIVLLFMGLRLPAVGAEEANLVSEGFAPVTWDQPTIDDRRTYVKKFKSRTIGRVTVYAEVNGSTVESLLISGQPSDAPPPSPCSIKPAAPPGGCQTNWF
jgi:hypothetical protein